MILKVIYLLTIYKLVLFFALSLIHLKKSRIAKFKGNYHPLVSVIVPCHNEEVTIANCLKSIIKSDFKNYEIITVNDGSTDKTLSVIKRFSKNHKVIKVFDQSNGGKASALNYGIQNAKGEIIICIDADSILTKDTISKLVRWFSNKKIGAVSGNIKIANKKNFWGIHQANEYISGLNLQRRSFEILNALQVIPGAVGAFRKDVLDKVGGYSTDTKVEDMDITIAIQKAGFKVVYEPEAIAYTEAPENIRDFFVQRHRWVYGSFNVIKKYKDLLFSKNGGAIGNIGLTYCLLFPFIDLGVSFAFFAVLINFFLTFNYLALIHVILVIILSHFIIIFYSLLIDRDDPKIALVSLIMGFWYYHLLSVVTLKAIYSLAASKAETHVVAKRLGKNTFKPAI